MIRATSCHRFGGHARCHLALPARSLGWGRLRSPVVDPGHRRLDRTQLGRPTWAQATIECERPHRLPTRPPVRWPTLCRRISERWHSAPVARGRTVAASHSRRGRCCSRSTRRPVERIVARRATSDGAARLKATAGNRRRGSLQHSTRKLHGGSGFRSHSSSVVGGWAGVIRGCARRPVVGEGQAAGPRPGVSPAGEAPCPREDGRSSLEIATKLGGTCCSHPGLLADLLGVGLDPAGYMHVVSRARIVALLTRTPAHGTFRVRPGSLAVSTSGQRASSAP